MSFSVTLNEFNTGYPHPVSKVICVGRNYIDHAKELNNPIPDKPLLFVKPNTALCDFSPSFVLNQRHGDVHYEAEIALLVGKRLEGKNPEDKTVGLLEDEQVLSHICAVGAALDLTYRDLQAELKSKGHPWEIAKAFDNSCAVTRFVSIEQVDKINHLELLFSINGQQRQHALTKQMIFNPATLLNYISQFFTLNPGDIVLTGTPVGVGRLDQDLHLSLQLKYGEDVLIEEQATLT